MGLSKQRNEQIQVSDYNVTGSYEDSITLSRESKKGKHHRLELAQDMTAAGPRIGPPPLVLGAVTLAHSHFLGLKRRRPQPPGTCCGGVRLVKLRQLAGSA